MEKFWARPDNALNTAIDRARDEHLIIKLPDEGSAPVRYTAGFRDRETGQPAMLAGEED